MILKDLGGSCRILYDLVWSWRVWKDRGGLPNSGSLNSQKGEWVSDRAGSREASASKNWISPVLIIIENYFLCWLFVATFYLSAFRLPSVCIPFVWRFEKMHDFEIPYLIPIMNNLFCLLWTLFKLYIWK